MSVPGEPTLFDPRHHADSNGDLQTASERLAYFHPYLTFEDKEKGSLEAGKLADFIVLDKDVLTCPVDDVKDIEVEETFLGGKCVYQRGSQKKPAAT